MMPWPWSHVFRSEEELRMKERDVYLVSNEVERLVKELKDVLARVEARTASAGGPDGQHKRYG